MMGPIAFTASDQDETETGTVDDPTAISSSHSYDRPMVGLIRVRDGWEFQVEYQALID